MVERTPKILIVDDDPRLRDLLRRYLGENGFNVLVSENGEAMKRLWVREHFDVLILDLMMPGKTVWPSSSVCALKGYDAGHHADGPRRRRRPYSRSRARR